MSRKNIENVYALSTMQQGMLFHALRDPETGNYISQIAVDLAGIDVRGQRSELGSQGLAEQALQERARRAC